MCRVRGLRGRRRAHVRDGADAAAPPRRARPARRAAAGAGTEGGSTAGLRGGRRSPGLHPERRAAARLTRSARAGAQAEGSTGMTAPPAADQAHTRRIAERTRSARLIRDSIGLLSSKWSVDVLLALGDGTRRYHELLEDLAPISEKVLTQTLRAMERDGLLVRRVHAEVPPRVEYALSSLGATMAPPLKALGSWSLTHGKRVEEARDRFDARAASRVRAA